MPKMTGLDVLRKVSKENTRIVIITAFAEDHDVLAAIRGGTRNCPERLRANYSHQLFTRGLHRPPQPATGIDQSGAAPAEGGEVNPRVAYAARARGDGARRERFID